MKGNNLNVLLDTGFWIALYSPDKEPGRCEKADEILQLLEDSNILIPWPTLYEFVNSKLGRRDTFLSFKMMLLKANVHRISDIDYRELALASLFNLYGEEGEDKSLVDEVIKHIIRDKQLKIDYFVSFDEALCNFAMANGVKADLHT